MAAVWSEQEAALVATGVDVLAGVDVLELATGLLVLVLVAGS